MGRIEPYPFYLIAVTTKEASQIDGNHNPADICQGIPFKRGLINNQDVIDAKRDIGKIPEDGKPETSEINLRINLLIYFMLNPLHNSPLKRERKHYQQHQHKGQYNDNNLKSLLYHDN